VVAGLAIGGVFGGDDEGSETTAQTTPTTPTTETTETTETTPTVAMPEPPQTETEPESDPSEYPAGFERQFIQSCESGGLSRAGCECAYEEVQKQYTFPELLIALRQAQQGNPPAKIRNIFVQCAQQAGG
jgi:hypothetical protein